jgi:predicted dehydrogenase
MDAESSLSHENNQKLGVALVGLGKYAKHQLGPALKETKHCQLKGIVTGNPDKIPEWKGEYGIDEGNIYNYNNFDEIASNGDIDIIYIVLPNSLHKEYTIRAANAGKHVICEKPMATSVQECEEMIAACNNNKVQLSIGYRLHFEPHHQYVMEFGQGKMGKLTDITGEHCMKLEDTHAWRLKKDLAGGGPLMDVGIYVVQASCYTAGNSPVAVKEAAFGELTQPEIYQDVEQSISWTLEFPEGVLAKGECSYARDGDFFQAKAENGSLELKPAYPYNGIKGRTRDFPEVNQQALQMDDFARILIQGGDTIVPGEMGRRDITILRAIYEAAESGKSVPLDFT